MERKEIIDEIAKSGHVATWNQQSAYARWEKATCAGVEPSVSDTVRNKPKLTKVSIECDLS